jgi:protein TonB
MSYLNQAQDPRRRATAIAATAVVHAALGVAVVTGMTVAGYTVVDTYVPIIEFPTEPTPPEPTPEPARDELTYIAPEPRPAMDLTQDPPTPAEITDPAPAETSYYPSGGESVTPPSLPQPPRFTPRRAAPSNSSAGWITTDDYPQRELRSGAEGAVGYRLEIGINGRVTNCELTRPSGVRGLDSATCRLIASRARFEPATDETGAKVAGSFAGSVRWEIPE